MELPARILENPVLTIATTLTAIVAVLGGIVGSLGLPPFWSDVMVSVITAYTTVHWAGHIWSVATRKEKVVGLGSKPETRRSRLRVLRQIDSSIILLPVLGALFVWNVTLPIGILGNRKWMFCGTITTSCSTSPCLRLYDSRKRLISDDCYQFNDQLGYIEISAPDSFTYQPEFVSLRCNGASTEIIKTADSMRQAVNPSCDALMKMP